MNSSLLEQKREAKFQFFEAQAEKTNRFNQKPRLDWLFFELTNACNLTCRHCASSCSPKNADFLEVEDIEKVLDSAQNAYGTSFTVALTGGEPMLHPEFFKVTEILSKRELPWGMTTNASLIGPREAELLHKNHIGSLSVSLDGLEKTHDYFRCSKGNFEKTIEGILNLRQVPVILQVTTVVHKKNLPELPLLFDLVKSLGIDSWRLALLDPVGRGAAIDKLVLSPDEVWDVLRYVRHNRIIGTKPEIVLGCPHYFSYPFENEVRDEVFYCGSGKTVAGVTSTGDYIGCLDVPRIPELIQGNLKMDDFSRIWEEHYTIYRSDFYKQCKSCLMCPESRYCRGDAMHTWDFKENRPLVCYRTNFDKL